MSLAEKICRRFAALKTEHAKWSGIWQDCARYTLPNSAPLSVFSVKTRGGAKRQPIDTTGTTCLTKLASWLFSSTIYQGEQWFDLKAVKRGADGVAEDVVDPELDKIMQSAARATLECIANSEN